MIKNQKRAKEGKLMHYLEKEPAEFLQFDVFVNAHEDDLMVPDEDGDAVFTSTTVELMSGVVDVRVLVIPGTSSEDTMRALGKVINLIKEEPEVLRTEEEKRKERVEKTASELQKLVDEHGLVFSSIQVSGIHYQLNVKKQVIELDEETPF